MPAALFLLPYLVQDALLVQKPALSNAIFTEIMAVLGDGSSFPAAGADTASRAAGQQDVLLASRLGLRHSATQAVFSLLDALDAWCLTSPAAPTLNAAVRLLQSIPQVSLADAAASCGANARALRHLESSLRATVTEHADSGLPKLPTAQLSKLQRVYSQLDEPDGLAGISALRSVCVGAATSLDWFERLQERIIDCEHDGKWSEALVCFEQALQHVDDGAMRAESATGAPAITDPGLESELHTGILRCLQNAGHLETALHRGIGVLSQRPELAHAITPLAAEAAWRLGRWDALDELLHNDVATSTSLVSVLDQKKPILSQASLSQDYGALLGSVMLNLVNAPAGSVPFREALDAARLNVMAGLSAASMESYHR